MKYTILAGAMISASLLAIAPAAQADQIGFTINSNAGATGNGLNSFLGYQFTVDHDILLTGLGIVDVDGNTTIENHYVGLFASNGTTLLASTTIAAGSSAPALTDIFNAVGPILLTAGTYDIGAYYSAGDNTDRMIGSNANFTPANGVTWVEALDNAGGAAANLNYSGSPFHSTSQHGFFGPDFEFTDAPVPEPASLALMGSALAGLGFLRRKRN